MKRINSVSNKKAQGLSLNVIIIAVIVLIVLVILVVILSGKMKGFREGINNCDGVCEDSASDCKEETPIYLTDCKGKGTGKYCCKK